jgi:hypothetical protein
MSKTSKTSLDAELKPFVDFTSPVEEEIKEEEPVEVPPTDVEMAAIDTKVHTYVCRVKCWVAGKKQVYEQGDVVEFLDGEFVPSHFELVK